MTSATECNICTMNKSNFITFKCSHSCCDECYSKISKCHICRSRLDKIEVKKLYISIHNILIPFYFCRDSFEVDYELQVERNAYIIHNILAAHNITGFMDKIKFSYDVAIDLSSIEKDIYLTNRLTDNLGRLKKDIDICDEVTSDDVEEIIEKHYYEIFAWKYRGQPSDEFMEKESKNLFKNVIMKVRNIIAKEHDDYDFVKDLIQV